MRDGNYLRYVASACNLLEFMSASEQLHHSRVREFCHSRSMAQHDAPNLAGEIICRSFEYCKNLRNQAIAKGLDHQKEDEGLIFTLRVIKNVLGDGKTIDALLRCACVPCREHNPESEETRARESRHLRQSDDGKFQAIAVLVLSNCLYALRSFLRSKLLTITAYVDQLDNDRSGLNLRGGLFDPLMHSASRKEDREARAKILSHELTKSIRAKIWLVEIPSFDEDGGARIQDVTKKSSLPFVGESFIRTVPQKQFSSFMIADGYVDPPQLSVSDDMPVASETMLTRCRDANCSESDLKYQRFLPVMH